MYGDTPSFGGLDDEAAAGDEVRASGDSDETAAAAAGLVLPSTAGACAHHELTSRVDRGVPVPIPGAHQRMRTRVCVDPGPTAASPDGCTLSGRSNCPREGMQLSSLAGDQMRNLDADNCRDPLSELCVSLSWNENLVAHRQGGAGFSQNWSAVSSCTELVARGELRLPRAVLPFASTARTGARREAQRRPLLLANSTPQTWRPFCWPPSTSQTCPLD
jgi:hypothetical protein